MCSGLNTTLQAALPRLHVSDEHPIWGDFEVAVGTTIADRPRAETSANSDQLLI
jgi:hypothetical protein